MTINLLSVSYLGERQFAVSFSDSSTGTLNMAKYLESRSGPLLAPLFDEPYLSRGFVDAAALAWPNGLEISPSRLFEVAELVRHAA